MFVLLSSYLYHFSVGGEKIPEFRIPSHAKNTETDMTDRQADRQAEGLTYRQTEMWILIDRHMGGRTDGDAANSDKRVNRKKYVVTDLHGWTDRLTGRNMNRHKNPTYFVGTGIDRRSNRWMYSLLNGQKDKWTEKLMWLQTDSLMSRQIDRKSNRQINILTDRHVYRWI